MLAVHKSHASILLRGTKSVVSVGLVIIPVPRVVFCLWTGSRLRSPLSHSGFSNVHYNRGSQVMNICVSSAVKISLITAGLESKAAYLAGQQAARPSLFYLLGTTCSHVMFCCGRAYLLYLFLLSLSVFLFTGFQALLFLPKERRC